MKKLLALISARNKEFYRDRTSLIWALLFPFIVLAGFNFGYSGRQDPILRVVTTSSNEKDLPFLKALKELPGLKVTTTDLESLAIKKLEHYESDLAVFAYDNGNRIVYSLNKDSDKGKLAEQLLTYTLSQQRSPHPSLESRPVSGRRTRYSDWLLPGLLAMNIMFGSMFGVGFVIVRYRKNGVLKRLRATPLTAFQFLTAQVISRMLLMVLTSFIIIGGSVFLIGFQLQGSWVTLILFLCASTTAMVSLGLVVAARITAEEVAEGVLNLMTWPMIFLSGIWFSIEGAAPWVQWGAKVMPLTHVVNGLRSIMLEGATLNQVLPQISILLGLSVVFLGIGSALFRWR